MAASKRQQIINGRGFGSIDGEIIIIHPAESAAGKEVAATEMKKLTGGMGLPF